MSTTQKSKRPVFDAVASRKARDKGIKQAEDNARIGWRTAMDKIVVEVARKNEYFTTDDIFELADKRNVPPTHENRAMGGVMTSAARDEICARSNRFEESRRKSRHYAPLRVWKSKLFHPTSIKAKRAR